MAEQPNDNAKEPFSRRLLRRLAPADPARQLPPEQMRDLAPTIKRVNDVVPTVWVVATLAFTALFALALLPLYRAINPPPTDAAYVSQPWWSLPVAAFPLAIVAGVVPTRLVLRRMMDGRADLHDRYEETKNGYSERRGMMIFGGVLVAGGLFAVYAACYLHVVIDAAGMRYPAGLSRAVQGYDDVTHIERYSAIDAPVGRMDRENIVVRFNNGPPMRLSKKKRKLPPEKLDAIATYISERSGVTIVTGDVRPKE